MRKMAIHVAYHFLTRGPDNVFTLQPGLWMTPFWVTSVLIVITSGAATLVALRVVSGTGRARMAPSVGTDQGRKQEVAREPPGKDPTNSPKRPR